MRLERTATRARVLRDDGTLMLDVTLEAPPEGWPDKLLRSFAFEENGTHYLWDGSGFAPTTLPPMRLIPADLLGPP